MKKKQVETAAKVLKKKIVAQVDKGMIVAEKELAKAKKQLEKTYAIVESYVKKNPQKAAMVAAGIGVALGAAVASLMKSGKKGKK